MSNTIPLRSAQATIKPEFIKKFIEATRTSIYGDKVLACVREVLCNAFDSHRRAGVPLNLIRVEMPNYENNYSFIVRDYGTGLTGDQGLQVFSSFGESDKGGDISQIGQYGVGAKAPHAVVDTFHVNCYKDGMKYELTSTTVESQNASAGSVNIMSESQTDEPNGVEVIVPGVSAQIHNFITRITDIISLLDAEDIPLNLLESGKITQRVPVWTHTFDNGDRLRLFTGQSGPSFNNAKTIINLGGCYMRSAATLDSKLRDGAFLVLDADPNYITAAMSREVDELTEKSEEYYEKVIDELELIILQGENILKSDKKFIDYNTELQGQYITHARTNLKATIGGKTKITLEGMPEIKKHVIMVTERQFRNMDESLDQATIFVFKEKSAYSWEARVQEVYPSGAGDIYVSAYDKEDASGVVKAIADIHDAKVVTMYQLRKMCGVVYAPKTKRDKGWLYFDVENNKCSNSSINMKNIRNDCNAICIHIDDIEEEYHDLEEAEEFVFKGGTIRHPLNDKMRIFIVHRKSDANVTSEKDFVARMIQRSGANRTRVHNVCPHLVDLFNWDGYESMSTARSNAVALRRMRDCLVSSGFDAALDLEVEALRTKINILYDQHNAVQNKPIEEFVNI